MSPFSKPLTSKQAKVLKVIEDFIHRQGKPPSTTELKELLNISSLRTVSQYLSALQDKGYITRSKYQKRSIKLTDTNKKTVLKIPVLSSAGADNMSVYADQLYDEFIEISRQLLKGVKPENVVAIKAVGDSMVDADIHSGDYVVTEMTQDVQQDDLVVAIIDGMAVIKRIFFGTDKIILNPENRKKQYHPIVMQRDFQIFGRVIDSIKMSNQNSFKYVPIDY